MATIEKLFMQIFDRKRSIIEHLKQQKQFYDQHLISKLLIQGIPPPSWLVNSELGSSTSDLTAINKEKLITQLLLPRSGRLPPYPSGTCLLYDQSVATTVNDELPHETCAKTCASSNGSEENEPGVIPSCHLDGAEDGANIVPSCHVDGPEDGANIVPSSHVDGTEDMSNYAPMSPEEQTNMMNCNTYLKLEESLARIQRSRSRQKALELRNSAKASGKSCLGMENNIGISSGNKIFGFDRPLDGIGKSVELVGPSALSTCIDKEAAFRDWSNKEMRGDVCTNSSSQSKGKNANDVQTEGAEKMEKPSDVYVGRNTRSRSRCSQSSTAGHQNNRKSHEICIGRMTRSRSGKAQLQQNVDPQNRRVTRSHCNQIQSFIGSHTIRNSRVDSGRISKARSGGTKEEEKKDHRSRTKNEMSVEPKQLDFDEFEETSLTDSLSDCKGTAEEKRRSHDIEEKAASLPCALSAQITSEKCDSLAYGTQEVPEIEVDHILPKSDRISGQNLFLPDFPPDSQGAQELMLGSAGDDAEDPGLSIPNSDIATALSSQKRKYNLGEEQELNKEASPISLHNADEEATTSSHRDAVATFSSEKSRHELSSSNDRKGTSNLSLPIADIEATMSLNNNAAEATKSFKKARLDTRSWHDCNETSYQKLHSADTKAPISMHEEAVEATLSSEKSRHGPSPSNDCKEASYPSLPNADSEPTMSLDRDAVEAVLSLENTRLETSPSNDCNETSCLRLPNADTEATTSLHKDAVEANASSEYIRHVSTSCNDFRAPLKTETAELDQPSLVRKSAGSLASVLNSSRLNTRAETRMEHACETWKSGSQVDNANMQSSCFSSYVEGVGCPKEPEVQAGIVVLPQYNDMQTSCFSSHVEAVGCSKLPEVHAGIEALPEYDVSNAIDGSWPCYKRRKIGDQLHHTSASPSVRVNTFPGNNECNSRTSLCGGKENSSSILPKLIISPGSDDVLPNSEFVPRAAEGIKYVDSEEPELAPEVQHEEDKFGLERSVMMPFICEQTRLSTSRDSNLKEYVTTEPLERSSEQEVREPRTSKVHDAGRLCNALEFADRDLADKWTSMKTIPDKRESLQQVDKLEFSIGSPLMERMHVDEADSDEIVPEFESFIIAEKRESLQSAEGPLNDKIRFLSGEADCSNLPEQIPGPVSLTPASPFPTGYKLHFTPGAYRSVPNGVIENIDLTSNLLSGKALQAKSYSDYHSFPSKRLGWDLTKPSISPMGKGLEGIACKSGGSEKQLSGNPELICFPIQEDPETSEEDMNVYHKSDTGMDEVEANVRSSPDREPLRDISEKNEIMPASSHAIERPSLESVTTEISIGEKHIKDNKKSEVHQRTRRTRQGKENQSLSIGVNSIKKHSESLSNMYSRPKLSGKSDFTSRGQSLSERESKRNNIVSNVKSFIPLVQQKQAASVVPAKPEFKVKALEAAEAAKRLAEKKENERKQKKEALKLERARLEQENLKQMELKKKLKEEEKRKRDAEIAAKKRQKEEDERKEKERKEEQKKKRDGENAAKKRQREEEDRKEKERKRKRLDEARCHQKQAEENISAWREESRCETQDGKAHERKESNEAGKAAEKESISRIPEQPVGSDRRKCDASVPSTNDNKSSSGSSDTGKVVNNEATDVSTPTCDKSDKLINKTIQEQSYDISPYQCSDDEDEEEDDIPNKKFIPTWASKSNVAMALPSLKHLDPDTIFPPGSFCSLEEVLLPRRLTQK